LAIDDQSAREDEADVTLDRYADGYSFSPLIWDSFAALSMTDQTEHTIAVALTLAKNGRLALARLQGKFLAWTEQVQPPISTCASHAAKATLSAVRRNPSRAQA
jgi:hypothetical protein